MSTAAAAPAVKEPRNLASDAPFMIAMNARSGHDDAAQTRALVEQRLAAAGRRFRIAAVASGSEITEVARRVVAEARECNGAVVVAGGDGTINAVSNAVYGSGCPLGVLPQGTFNFFARTHGIPLEPERALDVLLTARAHPVQAGLVNERLFLVNASLGLYPQILEDREGFKRRFGRRRWVALLSGLATVLHHHRPLTLAIEHEGVVREVRTPTLFVGNNRLQLEQVGIAEAPAVVHDRLVGLVLRPVGLGELLWLAVRGAFGTLGEAEDIRSFAFGRITVRPRRLVRQLKVAADGEISWVKAPIEFRVAPEPLYLLKPEPQAGRA
jgi:diacylglycerol kinase family enzyme